ncbi:hypothetical protein [Thermoactinomyces sp. CICC 10523]|uniref:hypothetical protein n=1 Tax=Thermoactinomyces sp. CICC 10523 TaxID=2767428 RepID=UPI0018DB5E94|nr:hypothetical protein [Thermoactinomyces sp. CICC 10523]MBH8599591.1 hypothetical protein [Thermoactinomyces sp. CICC 10523]
MNIWESHQIEEKIREVLQDEYKGDHHFGNPLMTAFQIAIGICKRYPDLLVNIDMQIGGEGVDKSFARYLANQLSKRIKNGTISDIEGFSISGKYIREIDFSDHEHVEREANIGSEFSAFRLKG